MAKPLDEVYISWLYGQVASTRYRNPNKTFWSLSRALLSKEYIWFIPNDDNRVEDGRDLRYEFLEERDLDADQNWLSVGCSMFEMLLGLCRRLSFEAGGEVAAWFWELLTNLDLKRYTDAYFDETNPDQVERVNDILDAVIWRTYQMNGQGGLFPLEHPDADQRDVELWYQQAYYVLERE